LVSFTVNWPLSARPLLKGGQLTAVPSMIIFDHERIGLFESHLSKALQQFNDIAGAAYGVSCVLEEGAVESLSLLYSNIPGLPESPGPFKQLAAFSVLSQEVKLFRFEPSVEDAQLDIRWNARISLWCLSSIALTLRLNGDYHPIIVPVLPTPHFQAEFVNHLRSFFYGRLICEVETSVELLCERILSTALILEAASYAKNCTDQEFIKNAEDCLAKIAADQVLVDDIRFNDPNFLELAVGISLED